MISVPYVIGMQQVESRRYFELPGRLERRLIKEDDRDYFFEEQGTLEI